MRDDVKQWIKDFDDGQPIRTLEMGGLGPGYEQAIQLLVVELVRAEASSEEDIDTVVKEIDKKLGGLSGAQVGAASWLAQYILKYGPEKPLQEAKKRHENDRCIMIDNCWYKLD